jgi:alkaline phosphatase D
VYENYVKLNKEERAYLIKRIAQEDIKNVIFLSGDRHHTELNKLVNAKGNTMYDFTSSPMTSGTGPRKESSLNRVEGTLVTERNFGTLDFSGPRKQRKLTMTTWSKEGKKLWEKVIQAE